MITCHAAGKTEGKVDFSHIIASMRACNACDGINIAKSTSFLNVNVSNIQMKDVRIAFNQGSRFSWSREAGSDFMRGREGKECG